MTEILIKVKCAYCEKPMDIPWSELPRQKRDFCCEAHHDKYKKEHGLDTDPDVRLYNSFGTGSFRDIAPKVCQELGILKCTQCSKIKCDKPYYDLFLKE
jgi:hypothetical protein